MITREKIIDITGYSWKELEPKQGEALRLGWFHSDVEELDGLEIVWHKDAKNVLVVGEDQIVYGSVALDKLDTQLKNAIGYAQMAGGLTEHYEVTNPPNDKACRMFVEALELLGETDAAFSGSEMGVSCWLESDAILEYRSDLNEYQIWSRGNYWVAATPAGVVKQLKLAQPWIEKVKQLDKEREAKIQSETKSEELSEI